MNNFSAQQDNSALVAQYISSRGISLEGQQRLGIRYIDYETATSEPYGFGKLATSPYGLAFFSFAPGSTEGAGKNYYPTPEEEADHLERINAYRQTKKLEPAKRVPKYILPTGKRTKPAIYNPFAILNPDSEQEVRITTEDVIGAAKAALRGIPIASTFGVWLGTCQDLEDSRDEDWQHPLKGQFDSIILDSDCLLKPAVMAANVRNGFLTGSEVGCFPSHPDKAKIGLDEWLDLNPQATSEDLAEVVKQQCADVLTWLESTLPGLLETIKTEYGENPTTASVISSEVRKAAINELFKHQTLEDLRASRFYDRALKPLGLTLEDLRGKEAAIKEALGERKPHERMADLIISLVKKETFLFHDSEQNAYADLILDDCRHTYPLKSADFKRWVYRRIYETYESTPNSEAYQSARTGLEALASFDSPEYKVWLRVAEADGKHYLDLANERWQAVEIDSEGWRIVDRPPVRFIRPNTMLGLPNPIEGGNLDELKDLLGVDSDNWILLITFLLYCFTTGPTFPVLLLAASRGSGKTTIAEFLKSLVDPGKAGLIGLSADTQKMAVAAGRRWLLGYDNISSLSKDESDLLCRLATGFGTSTRTLFTTDEETVWELARPQILTAIDHVVTRDDLSDRLLMVQLPSIDKKKRLRKGALDRKLEQLRPKLLGALLTALSGTLAALPNTPEEDLPRMADFGHFALAAEGVLGFESGTFRKIFDANREAARQVVLEASPLAEAIQALVKSGNFKGTMSALLKRLENFTEESVVKSRYWPKASNALSRQLGRLKPDLEAVGIIITLGGREDTPDRERFITIARIATEI